MLDINKLNKSNYTVNKLAEIYTTINKFEWHSELGEKPFDWDNIPDFSFSKNHTNTTKSSYISSYCSHIRDVIGEKECLRYLHINKLDRTNFQFEVWWLNQTIQRILGIGFHSKREQRNLKGILTSLKEEKQKEWNKKNYQ